MEPRAEVWTTRQFARVMQLSESRARQLMEGGEVPGAIKIGGTWRIHAPSVYRWMSGWATKSGEMATPAADVTSH